MFANPTKIEQVNAQIPLTLPSAQHIGGNWEFCICPENKYFYGIASPNCDELEKLPTKLYQFGRRNFHQRKEFPIIWNIGGFIKDTFSQKILGFSTFLDLNTLMPFLV